MDLSYIDPIKTLLIEYWPHLGGYLAVTGAGIGTAIFAYIRRPKSSTSDSGPYFTDAKLLSPPLARPAYSDRMAYVLSEMASLAYYQFEGEQGLLEDAIELGMRKKLENETDIREFLEDYTAELMGGERRLGQETMKRILDNSGFTLLDVINIGETQGFVCRRTANDEPAYLVLAFRGTEKKISDWLTDARCIPVVYGKDKIHKGFYRAFCINKDADGNTVEDKVTAILNTQKAKDESENPLPLFITGHSLGGALALLATKQVASDVNGACYTFGAPRVGNYEYFRSIKTPVFRIVNSSDIVPRVPPGASMMILVLIVQAMAWLTRFVPVISSLFDKLEGVLDKLNGYRHFGDLRYLSDVSEGKFSTVRLLTNPPAIDRIVWMWRHVGKSFLVPIKSHGMSIYRKKLSYIASERNNVGGTD